MQHHALFSHARDQVGVALCHRQGLSSAGHDGRRQASWAEQPNRQFQRLLADTLAGAGVAVLDTRSGGVAPARTLTGHLREFGLDVRGAPVVRVRYDAQLAGPRGAGTVALRSFVAEEKVTSQQPAVIAAALNRAANRLAGEVAAWVKG